MYSEKGARSGADFEKRLGYVELPLHASLSSPDIGPIRVFVGGAVVYSHEVHCGGHMPEFVVGPADGVIVNPQRCGEEARSRDDRGEELRGGLVLGSGARRFTLEVRHTRGTRNLLPSDAMYNDVTTIYVGIAHKLTLRAPRGDVH